MTRRFGFLAVFFSVACLLTLAAPASVSAPEQGLEEGDVKGKIEGVDGKFLRDYETLNYKGEKEWQKWGKGLKSMGWIKVQGESGELKDLYLLIINNRTRIVNKDGSQGQFTDFKAGQTIQASYRMAWDALHALEVKILK